MGHFISFYLYDDVNSKDSYSLLGCGEIEAHVGKPRSCNGLGREPQAHGHWCGRLRASSPWVPLRCPHPCHAGGPGALPAANGSGPSSGASYSQSPFAKHTSEHMEALNTLSKLWLAMSF